MKNHKLKKLLACFLTAGILKTAYEDSHVKITEYNISFKRLPKILAGFRILHISDFHNSHLLRQTIKQARLCLPNLIVITGDLIDARRTNTKCAMELCRELVKLAPVYYVPGNHEASFTDYRNFSKSLTDIGVHVLHNKTEVFTEGDVNIYVSGIKDPQTEQVCNTHTSERIKNQLKRLNMNRFEYNILLSHRSEAFKAYAACGFDLVFSGHAHGGQFRLPLIGGLFAPNQGFFPKFTSGIYQKGNTTMVVSRGIGNSSFPLRLNNRPEIVLVTLTTDLRELT